MPKNFQISQYDEPLCVDGYLDVEVDGRDPPGRDRARAHGGGHRQVAARRRRHRPHPRRDALAARLQPRRHPAGRDRHRARHPLARGRQGLRRRAARAAAVARRLRGPHGAGPAALRRQRLAAPARRREVRHPHRDQERQLAALGRARGRLTRSAGRPSVLDGGGRIIQETRHFHEDDGTTSSGRVQGGGDRLPVLPRARPRADGARRASYVEAVRATLPELPAQRRARLQEQFGFSALDLEQMRSAGVLDLVEETIAAGAAAGRGPGLVAERAGARGRRAGVEPPSCRSPGADVARIIALVAEGTLTNALARQVVEGVLAGEGAPTRSSPPAGWRSSATTARSGRRSTRPSPARPTSPRRCAAARSPPSARWSARVMKATRGQADAARVRALLLEKLGARLSGSGPEGAAAGLWLRQASLRLPSAHSQESWVYGLIGPLPQAAGYVGGPLALARLGSRRGWRAGRPRAVNLVGLVPLTAGSGLLAAAIEEPLQGRPRRSQPERRRPSTSQPGVSTR